MQTPSTDKPFSPERPETKLTRVRKIDSAPSKYPYGAHQGHSDTTDEPKRYEVVRCDASSIGGATTRLPAYVDKTKNVFY